MEEEKKLRREYMIVVSMDDFRKICKYINGSSVPFSRVNDATQAQEALRRAVIMDIEIKEKKGG